jgi:hypothetical protein
LKRIRKILSKNDKISGENILLKKPKNGIDISENGPEELALNQIPG